MELKNNVAVLKAPNPAAPDGTTTVYVLGMSHVSQKSCDHIRQLVQAVRPEVVAVELCRDRLGLLVDSDRKVQNCWHVRKVLLEGVPGLAEWPTASELKALLKSKIGCPVSTQDIEDDVRTLLATGLFKSVKPAAETAYREDAPEFVVQPTADGIPQLNVVPPLGSLRFLCVERSFPPVTTFSARLDSSLKDTSVTQEQLDEVCAAAVEDSRAGTSSLLCLLRARGKFIELCGVPAAVAFTGAEVGRVEVVVKAQKPSDPAYLSGLESSAIGGEGVGIDIFRPARSMYTISENMSMPTDAVERLLAEQRAARGVSSSSGAEANWAGGSGHASSSGRQAGGVVPRTQYREWTDEEILNPASPSIPSQPVADAFSALLTSTYGKIQADAGETVGIEPGAAWRVALDAATECGAQQFLLADRPADVTQRKLADKISASIGTRIAGTIAIVAAAVAATTQMLVPDAVADAAVVFVAVGGTVQLMWPVVGPFFEVWRFSKMSAEEIEDTVAMKTPIDQGDLSQPIKVFGEDALLDWPGAMGPVIDDRDAFMGKALAAAATGKGVTPGYVVDEKEGKLVWRYMMAEGAPTGAAPAGRGDGSFKPLPGPKAVVAVVGTAHVHGMVRDWEVYLRDTVVDDLVTVT